MKEEQSQKDILKDAFKQSFVKLSPKIQLQIQ